MTFGGLDGLIDFGIPATRMDMEGLEPDRKVVH